MSDQFVAEIRIFPFNFAPTGWAFCDGQLMPISQNTALFSLLGTTYGGDGKSTFALPNVQDSTVMQQGQGQGLSLRDLGESGGEDNVTLLQSEMPGHTHAINVASGRNTANNFAPSNLAVLAPSVNFQGYSTDFSALTPMAPLALNVAGGSLPHNNMQPYLTLSFCIALQGIFPPRS
jgi:microcystin-dependent protein